MRKMQQLLKINLKGVFSSREAGLKYFSPIRYGDFKKVDRPKLRVVEKMPPSISNMRPQKMQKKLKLMRGPENIHNSLLHKQFGIVALSGGRLLWGHFEMIRLTIGRKIDINRMFAIWRVPAPWLPVTKKGQGQRMGGGKGAIDHYVTPVKNGRVIMELVGKCEYEDVEPILKLAADKLPFKASVVSEKCISKINSTEERCELDTHSFPMKYVIQNNLNGYHKMLSPVDHKWFGRFI